MISRKRARKLRPVRDRNRIRRQPARGIESLESRQLLAAGDVLVSPGTVVNNTIGDLVFGVDRAIDQSGLSAPYTSGVTGYDSYIAGNPTHDSSGSSTRWSSQIPSTGGVVDFQLASPLATSGIVLWNSFSPAWNSFEVFSSVDNTFTNLTSLGTFSAATDTSGPFSLQEFTFTSAPTTEFLRLQLHTIHGNPTLDSAEISEIAFRASVPNVAPTIISGDAVLVTENQTVAIDVQATDDNDSEGSGLSFSFGGGPDDSLFNIDSSGLVTFKNAPDFENPGDTGGDNTYNIRVNVTDSGGLTAAQDVMVTVDNVNEPPVIQGGDTADYDVPENTTPVAQIMATDPDLFGGPFVDLGGVIDPIFVVEGPFISALVYNLTTDSGGGNDNHLFNLDSLTGELRFINPPDFENPQDTGTNNVYDVQVTVTEFFNYGEVIFVEELILTVEPEEVTEALSARQDIQVRVTNVNEPPQITSDATATVAENQISAIDVQATDDTDSEGNGLSYSLSGGADQALFNLDAATGVLTFIGAPDFENPSDAGADNQYNVQVTVTDSGGLTAMQDIVVAVDDVVEVPPPGVTVVGDTLFVVGENNVHDRVTIGETASAFQVRVNGALQTIPKDGVTAVQVITDGGRDNVNLNLAGSRNVIVDVGDGNDVVRITNDGPTLVRGGGGNDNIVGGNGPNTLFGDAGNDSLTGRGSADEIEGGAGNDLINGGGGDDTLRGDGGDDTIRGGAGDDVIRGGEDDDFLLGDAGDDILLGEGGDDDLRGGTDRDLLIGGLDADRLQGQAGDDILIGSITVHDSNDMALKSILALWTQPGAAQDRINSIQASPTALLGGTDVLDDSAVDTLLGGTGQDFGFQANDDVLIDTLEFLDDHLSC